MSIPYALLEELDTVEQMVAAGELCAMDGKPCELETRHYRYGEDADGNRGTWVEHTACRTCGESP
jgi:hypothetical protein